MTRGRVGRNVARGYRGAGFDRMAECTCVDGASLAAHPAISVIIPAYNVGDELLRALVTVSDQTLTDMEILLVDDGSTDATGRVADEYALIEPRLRVIHQENAGAAAARNRGMAEASGEYLFFMDGDDWCEPAMLAQLYACAKDYDLDLVITGFVIETQTGNDRFYREERTAPNAIYADQADFRAHAIELLDAQLLYAPWNKLYRRAYLVDHALTWPDTFWDDLPFNLSVLRDIERVGCVDGHGYHFLRARAESENTRYRPDMYAKRQEEDEELRELFDHWGMGDDDRVRRSLALRYAERLLGCVENLTTSASTLTPQEKRLEVCAMLENPRSREALELAEPQSAMMRVLLGPLRAGDVSLTLAQSLCITGVKEHAAGLFARLKSHRQRW